MKKNNANHRILLVDDHPMMRQGLVQLIEHEADLSVAGEANTAAEALDSLAKRTADLVLVDLSLPDRSGLELIRDILVLQPGILVLVFSMHDESVYAERVLRAGGRGYIMKQEGGKKLMHAMRQVLAGHIYVSEKISARILEIYAGRRIETASSPMELLTDREFEIFELMGQGRSSREIAEHLRLSVKTIEVHRANIKRKLKVKTGLEMVRVAVQWIEGRNPLRSPAAIAPAA